MIKCIIWDLDNTIWHGIIEEEKSVILNDKIINYIKCFHQRGVINSICSKNDYKVVQKELQELDIWKYSRFRKYP